MEISQKEINDLRADAKKTRQRIRREDRKMIHELKKRHLSVPKVFLGLHSKADYTMITLWFGNHREARKAGKSKSYKPEEVSPRQLKEARQFYAVEPILSRKNSDKFNLNYYTDRAEALADLKAGKELPAREFSVLNFKEQHYYQGYPADASVKEINEIDKETENEYLDIWSEVDWSPAQLHFLLAHYPAEIIKKIADKESKDGKGCKAHEEKEIHFLKGKFSMQNPNKKPVDFSKIKVMKPVKHAKQVSLF